MNYILLASCCALLCFGATNAVASLGVALFWRFAGRQDISGTSLRSNTIFALRMLPTAAATFFVLFVFLPGFLYLEPRNTDETVGPLMLGIAAIPTLLIVLGATRAVICCFRTRSFVKHWSSRGERLQLPADSTLAYSIDSDFPIVTLAGVLRPRLFLSRQVLSSCTTMELTAVLSHERAHRENLDNLKRLLIRSCPDFLSITSLAKSFEHEWCEASELAADETAAGPSIGIRAELAAALVKIARLAVGRSFPYNVPAGAFHDGGSIDQRIRRLLNSSATSFGKRGRARWAGIGLAIFLLFSLALELNVLIEVHRLTEAVVAVLQ